MTAVEMQLECSFFVKIVKKIQFDLTEPIKIVYICAVVRFL